MQHYQPPHIRGREPSSSSTTAQLPTTPTTAGPSHRPWPSRRDWSTTTSVLASPASDLRPMRRSLAIEVDEMDFIQSVSRSGGDGAEGDTLKIRDVQERYRAYIDARVDKHYSTFSRARDTPPPSDAREELESLGSIVLLYRKLREGIVASHRTDTFAVSVFEDSARLAILAHNAHQVVSALSGLVPDLYTNASETTFSSEPDGLSDTLSSLSLSDRRAEFASLLLLYHLAHSHSSTAFHSTLVELTAPSRRPLRALFSSDPATTPTTKPFLPLVALKYAIRAARVLAPETLDPLGYLSLLDDPSVKTYERTLLSWAKETMREKAWLVMQKAYLELGIAWAGRIMSLGEADVDVWVRERCGKVERGKVRTR